jgi:hypothetical protein
VVQSISAVLDLRQPSEGLHRILVTLTIPASSDYTHTVARFHLCPGVLSLVRSTGVPPTLNKQSAIPGKFSEAPPHTPGGDAAPSISRSAIFIAEFFSGMTQFRSSLSNTILLRGKNRIKEVRNSRPPGGMCLDPYGKISPVPRLMRAYSNLALHSFDVSSAWIWTFHTASAGGV